MWIINKYTSSRTFALIGDETKDKAGKNQFAISIRWVTYKYLALAAVGQTDDATLKNVPICNGLHISKCFGYVCNRAANMYDNTQGLNCNH